MYPFITDSLSFDKADTPEAMKKSGYAFGNFQYLLSDFPAEKLHETIPDFHNTVDRYAKFEQAVQKDVMGRVKEVEAEISFIKEREKDCHYFGDLLAAGAVSYTHLVAIQCRASRIIWARKVFSVSLMVVMRLRNRFIQEESQEKEMTTRFGAIFPFACTLWNSLGS